MITASKLLTLTTSKSEDYPVLDISDLKEKSNRIFKAYGFDELTEEMNEENIHSLYVKDNGGFCEVRHMKALEKVFENEEDIIKLIYSSPYTMHRDITDLKDDDLMYGWIESIRLSLWQNSVDNNWNNIVKFNNTCKSFNPFPEDDSIDVIFERPMYPSNPWGTGKSTEIYMDGRLGFVIRYKGVNSFIISVDLMKNNEIHIKQLQSVIPKRNKLRFKLGNDFFEKILKEFISHFNEFKVSLISGESMIKQIGYEGKDLEEVDNAAYQRIKSTYSQEFNEIQIVDTFTVYKHVGVMSPRKQYEFRELKI